MYRLIFHVYFAISNGTILLRACRNLSFPFIHVAVLLRASSPSKKREDEEKGRKQGARWQEEGPFDGRAAGNEESGSFQGCSIECRWDLIITRIISNFKKRPSRPLSPDREKIRNLLINRGQGFCAWPRATIFLLFLFPRLLLCHFEPASSISRPASFVSLSSTSL